MSIKIKTFRKSLDTMIAEKAVLQRGIKEKRKRIVVLQKHSEDLVIARAMILEATRMTQKNVKGYIESLVTLGLKGIFVEDYKFLCDFDEGKADKTECLLRVQEGDWEPFVPTEDQGCGILDPLAFSLMVVIWSLSVPKTRATFFLDEPARWIGEGESEDLRLTIDMIKEVSNELEIQLIINTHKREFARIADKLFYVKKVKKITYVTEAEGQQIEIGYTPTRKKLIEHKPVRKKLVVNPKRKKLKAR